MIQMKYNYKLNDELHSYRLVKLLSGDASLYVYVLLCFVLF